jgi:hypothetical protein
MAAKTRSRSSREPSKREVQSLVRKYTRALSNTQDSEHERLMLARKLHELAVKTEHAQMHVDIHTFGRKKPKTETYKLTDPRAALRFMNWFCNVWVPVPAIVCIAKFGCPAVKPPPPGFWLGCVLVGCGVNVCPGPGVPAFACVYLCL